MSSATLTLSSHVASQLECSICFGKLDEPKLLTCGHTFCRGCLEELVEPESFYAPSTDDNDPGIVCPLCRNVTQIPSDGVDGLTTNFALQSLLDSLSLDTSEVEEPDDEEEESTPKSGEVEDGELTMCELHKEKMKFYCSTCELLICRDCTVVDHPRPDHKCTNLDEAYTWRQQINQKELHLAKGLIKLNKKARGILLATVENLNQRCDQVINEIETCREEGMEMLKSKDALIEEYQCSLEEHTQHLRDLTQHNKGTTKIDVLDQSKSLVETLSSCREKRHEMLDTPSKVQYPMFVGAEEEIQGWPRPHGGPKTGHAKSKSKSKKKVSKDKTSETETDSMKGQNLASSGGMQGSPQAIYPPLPLMFSQQSSLPGGVPGEPQRGGGRGGKGSRGQGHRGGNQGLGGQGKKKGGGGGGHGGRGQGHGGQGGESRRGRGGQAGN